MGKNLLPLEMHPFDPNDPATFPTVHYIDPMDPEIDPNEKAFSLMSDDCVILDLRNGVPRLTQAYFWGHEKRWAHQDHVYDNVAYWCYQADVPAIP